MNESRYAEIAGRLERLLRPYMAKTASPGRRLAALGLVAIGSILIGAWLAGGFRQSTSVGPMTDLHAKLADSPSWQRIAPEWPTYMPAMPTSDQTAGPARPVAASEIPAINYGTPPEISPSPSHSQAAPQPIAAGPDVLATDAPPPFAAGVGPQPWTQTAPPQFVAPGPARYVPAQAAGPAPNQPPAYSMRTEAMEKISAQSDQRVRHGFELAGRGAYFAARAEFTAALRMIAQGLDSDQGTLVHSQALSAALTAMQEAQDFIPVGGKLEAELDLPPIVAGHRTPVLKEAPVEQLPAMRALKEYLTFAQKQLALAAGQEVSGSMALGALGKLHAALAGKATQEIAAPEAKAVAFFQAAILVCPKNYMAANDLGVLLAHNGDYVGARRALEHSVLVNRRSENLYNLSVVYRQLGDQRLSALAAEKSQLALAAETARQKSASLSAGGSVEWVDPAALVQSPGQASDPPRPILGQAPAPFGPAAAH
jgi:tetratricopeptide (TPR) repeat protein